MATFRQLVDTTAQLDQRPPEDWHAVNAALVPLAALALHSADRIEGLPEVLCAHGWRNDGFDGVVDLGRLKQDLWMLFSAHKERELLQGLHRARLEPLHQEPPLQLTPVVVNDAKIAVQSWDAQRPFESYRSLVRRLQHDGIAEGRLLNDLTHYAQVAINQAHKLRLDTEGFKRMLKNGGWNQNHYAFLTRPDMVHLLACLH